MPLLGPKPLHGLLILTAPSRATQAHDGEDITRAGCCKGWMKALGPSLLAAWALQGGWQALLLAPTGYTLGMLSRTQFSAPLALSLACWAFRMRWWLAWPAAAVVVALYAYLFLLGLASTLPAHRGGPR